MTKENLSIWGCLENLCLFWLCNTHHYRQKIIFSQKRSLF